jgi:TetR/AcrR family transcriptional regulator
MNKETTRGPGRPSAKVEQDARLALIDAAADRFAEQGFEATSLRAVATEAGVTPAMISYYFDDKAGLLEAVVIEGFERILATLRRALVRDDFRGDDRDALIPRFIGAYLRVLNRDPWIPKIIVREVISKDGPLRKLFVERFASQALALLPPEFVREIESGRLRGDLDPRFAILSIVGMCMFPYIAQPVLGPLFGYELTDEFGEEYSRHAIRLFLEGAGGQQ